VEHHLFPRICHVHYPNIAPIVEQTCREFGIPYQSIPTFTGAVLGHGAMLRSLGREDVSLAA
jgi:linoleoyl-CoA desaturase